MRILMHPCHVLYSLLVCVPVPGPASASSGVLPWVWCYVRVMLLQTLLQLHVLDKYRPGIGETPRWIPDSVLDAPKSAPSCEHVPSSSPYGIYIP